ncbi:MAG: helix-turn-helix domain-containing protein [Patescibacteria group bacterium]|jgi:cytoskeletal protein RodZ
MAEFTRKSLNNKSSLGTRLRETRELKQVDVALAAKKLGIRLEYLLALEEDRFDRLPAGLYGRNYVKKYGRWLGFPSSEINKWLIEQEKNAGPGVDPFSQKIVAKKEFANFPKLIRNLVLILILLAFLGYLAFYLTRIVSAPELVIFEPANNLKTTSTVWEISGHSEPEAEIRINGEEVLSMKNGDFSLVVNLKKGLNNITVSAKKKHSSEAVVERQILVE